jgi:putative colanic acid biosynthesis acetyltransferase WcaF
MAPGSCLSDQVDCYCVATVTLGPHATVSQYSYLCSASHDYRDSSMPLVIAPIVIGAEAWVAADVFVGPGVVVGEGAVVGARSTVMHDVEPWTVVAGSPPLVRGRRSAFKRDAVS